MRRHYEINATRGDSSRKLLLHFSDLGLVEHGSTSVRTFGTSGNKDLEARARCSWNRNRAALFVAATQGGDVRWDADQLAAIKSVSWVWSAAAG
jgi:hypothetical protein